jgi:hypothetical protein
VGHGFGTDRLYRKLHYNPIMPQLHLQRKQ